MFERLLRITRAVKDALREPVVEKPEEVLFESPSLWDDPTMKEAWYGGVAGQLEDITCTNCGKTKPETEFQYYTNRKTGVKARIHMCKACVGAKAVEGTKKYIRKKSLVPSVENVSTISLKDYAEVVPERSTMATAIANMNSKFGQLAMAGGVQAGTKVRVCPVCKKSENEVAFTKRGKYCKACMSEYCKKRAAESRMKANDQTPAPKFDAGPSGEVQIGPSMSITPATFPK